MKHLLFSSMAAGVVLAALGAAPAAAQMIGSTSGGFGTSIGAGGTSPSTGGSNSSGGTTPGTGTGANAGPFGQGVQSGLFGNNGLQVLQMAGMSALFNRNQGMGQQGGPLGAGQYGLGPLGGSPLTTFGQNPFGRGPGRGQFGNRASRPVLRTQLRVGFQSPPVRPTAVQQRLGQTLLESDIRSVGPIQVVTVVPDPPTPMGTTVILRGRVATLEDRQVAEQVALLDPAVARVRNELQVVGSSPATGR